MALYKVITVRTHKLEGIDFKYQKETINYIAAGSEIEAESIVNDSLISSGLNESIKKIELINGQIV